MVDVSQTGDQHIWLLVACPEYYGDLGRLIRNYVKLLEPEIRYQRPTMGVRYLKQIRANERRTMC